MFHIELRQFPHTARAFNLSQEELRVQILDPWVAGRGVLWADRRWSAEKAQLTIISGPELPPQAMGMGRGWQEALRAGEDLTTQMLEQARRERGGGEALQRLKLELVASCEEQAQRPDEVVELAGVRWSQHRVSERLAIAEQAIWELLHEGKLTLVRKGAATEPIPMEQWRATLLEWRVWSSREPPQLLLKAVNAREGTTSAPRQNQ